MPSNWKSWDYVKSYPTGHNPVREGIQLISTPDEYIQIIIRHLFDDADANFKIKFSDEITVQWLEKEFCTLSLFQQNESYIVYLNSNLDENVINFLKSSKIDFSGRFLVFLGLKFKADLKKLAEKNQSFMLIEAPKFWETREQLDFFSHHFGLYLSQDSKNYLLENLDINSEVLFESLSRLKSFYPKNEQLELSQVRPMIRNTQLDQFALAKEFGFKRLQPFYQKLLSTEKDYSELRQFFSFMQGHVIKMMDPSYSAKKKYLSKYDKEIQSYSKLWKTSELAEFLEVFSDLEILCKSQSSNLKNELRLKLLQSYI